MKIALWEPRRGGNNMGVIGGYASMNVPTQIVNTQNVPPLRGSGPYPHCAHTG